MESGTNGEQSGCLSARSRHQIRPSLDWCIVYYHCAPGKYVCPVLIHHRMTVLYCIVFYVISGRPATRHFIDLQLVGLSALMPPYAVLCRCLALVWTRQAVKVLQYLRNQDAISFDLKSLLPMTTSSSSSYVWYSRSTKQPRHKRTWRGPIRSICTQSPFRTKVTGIDTTGMEYWLRYSVPLPSWSL